MSTRQIRNRKVLRLECLEVRNAPSNFGVIGHAALTLHQVHAAVHVSQVHAAGHVSHVNDSRSTDKHHTPEVKSGTDKSVDPTGSETNSPAPSSPARAAPTRTALIRRGTVEIPRRRRPWRSLTLAGRHDEGNVVYRPHADTSVNSVPAVAFPHGRDGYRKDRSSGARVFPDPRLAPLPTPGK